MGVAYRLGLVCVSLGVLFAEPSAFDLQSGATKKELSSLKSSNKNLENVITTLQGQTNTLVQSQDGLKSLFEGQSAKLKDFSGALESHESSINALKATQEMQSRMLKDQASLLENLKNQVEANKSALMQLDKKIGDTNQLITQMNADFATKLEAIKKAVDDQANANTKKLQDLANIQEKIIQERQKLVPQAPQAPQPPQVQPPQAPQSFEKDRNKRRQIFQDALRLFHKKQYAGAGERFTWLAEIKYRPAYSYYMAGESAYEQKHYEEAINLYKRSALIKDKTDYMPILLWHTAWSFGFLKDHGNYERFMRSLAQLYPQSEQGKRALDILQKHKEKSPAKP